jgi:lycopene cyclase domain-containing protein
MIPLYFYILLGSISIPLLFTIFIKDFIKDWKQFFLSTIIIAIIFLVWDFYFTKIGVWSFNYNYCLGIKIFEMPIEEWLFFLIIPFCSLFIHFCAITVNPKFRFKKKTTISLTVFFIILSIIVVLLNPSKKYTAVNFSVLTIVLLLGFLFFKPILQQFYATFIIILIPFFIVNGILTGSFLETPIVNYNNFENLGIRVFTVPIEDIGYCFSMLFGNLMIYETLQKK